MKRRRKQPRQIQRNNKDTKRGNHSPNQREIEEDNNNYTLSDFPDCILLHILSFLNAKDVVAACLSSTRWKNLRNKDTLNDLPDCILLHILSFLNVKEAVRTSVLSTRWKRLWRRLPTLILSCSNFKAHRSFIKFVNSFLSLRDSSTELNALDFKWQGFGKLHLVNRIVRYAVSHNVNRLHLVFPYNHFPPSLFSCPSLTSLSLEGRVMFPNSLNFPELTYLKLVYFAFCSGNDGRVEPFSTFNKLNTLILDCCEVEEAEPLYISSTTILNLSIHTGYNRENCSSIVLFAPSLCTFAFSNNPFHKLSVNHLSSIKQVSIDLLCEKDYNVESSRCLLNWLREITDIRSLTVTPRTLRALSLIPGILKLKLPFLCNMKSFLLNVSWEYTNTFSSSYSWSDIKTELRGGKSWKENVKLSEAIKAGLSPRYSSIMDGMIGFLLQNSPSAKVDIVQF